MSKNIAHVLSILCILIYTSGIGAQDREVFFQNLREESGLDYHIINDIDQDGYGRLWLASFNGVYQYNGYAFKNILNDPNKSNTISSNLCTEVSVDRNENIWVGTYDKGLCIIVPRQDTVIRISDSLLRYKSQLSEKILALESTTDQGVFALTSIGLFQLMGTDDFHFLSEFIPLPDPLQPTQIRCMKYHSSGILFLGSSAGLLRWDASSKEWVDKNLNHALLSEPVSSMDIDPDGQLWMGVQDASGIYTFDPSADTIIPYPHVANMTKADRVHLCHDQDRYLWVVAGRQGVYRHDLTTKANEFFEGKDYDMRPGNFTNFTSNPLKDKFGNIWFCGGGIHTWSNTGKRFVQYTHPLGDYQATSAMYDDDDFRIQALWGNGSVIWNKKDNAYHQIRDSDEMLSNTTYAIGKFNTNEYIFCGAGGCNIIDLKRLEVRFAIPLPGTIFDLKKHNNQWMAAGSQGLWSFIDANTVTQLLKIKGLRAVEVDNADNLWIASIDHGLYHWNQQTDEVTNYRYDSQSKNSIQSDRIEDLDISSDGTIWLASSSGIEKFVPEENYWTNFLSDNKLAGIRANSVICLGDSLIWVSSNQSISRYEKALDRWTHFNEEDGILNPYFYERAAFKNQQGELFFAGRKGMTHFFSNEIKSNAFRPMLYFEQIKVDGKRHFFDGTPIKLNWKNRFIEFNFSGVHLTAPHSLKYAYRLLPIQENWTSIPRQPLYFNNLGPGGYALEIKTITHDGSENEQPLKAAISVQPPFWKHWFFWLATGLVLLVCVILWMQNRMNRLEKAFSLEQKIKTLEQAALQAQMNPHFIFNAMSGIQHFIIERDDERALKYMSIFGKLIRKILDYSHQKWIPLNEEIELIQHYIDLEKLRFDQSLEVDIQYPSEPTGFDIYIPPLLLQPIVENAFIHGLRHAAGRQKKITIEIHILNDKILQTIVRDNGIGREESRNYKPLIHKSKGSQNVQKRLQLVGEQLGVGTAIKTTDLYTSSNQPAGTEVKLQIPYKR